MSDLKHYIQQQYVEISSGLHEPELILNLRKKGIDQFEKQGFPHQKMEKWRHKAIDTLLENQLDTSFYKIQNQPNSFRPVSEYFTCDIKDIGTSMYTFLNGWYVHNHQPLEIQENGMVIGSILAAFEKYPDLIRTYFAQIDPKDSDGLIYLNQALFTDGLFVYVPDNVQIEQPIQIVSVVDSHEKIMVQHRHLVIIGKNSSLSLVHCDDSIHEESSFINNILEVNIAENGQLHYVKMENKDARTLLVNNTFVNQQRDSRFISNILTFNSGYVRNGIQVNLNAPGADAKLYGLYLVDKKQYVDNQVSILHNSPDCTSNQLYKGIADDEAGANFNGHIVVQKDAQRTSAYQVNRNIALTDDAKITTRPFLEIYADDVKCSHGATVGQLDENAMFYLRSRGICQRNARMLLMYAFANEVANYVEIDKLRERLNDMIKRRLKGELTICDQCMLHCSDEKNFTFDLDSTKFKVKG
jgi:Fe-S cluster assembly protein SufD